MRGRFVRLLTVILAAATASPGTAAEAPAPFLGGASPQGADWELRALGITSPERLERVRTLAKRRAVTLAVVGLGGISEKALAPQLVDGIALEYRDGARDPGPGAHDTGQARVVLELARHMGLRLTLLVYQPPDDYAKVGDAFLHAAKEADVIACFHSFWGKNVSILAEKTRRASTALLVAPYAEHQGRPTGTCWQAHAAKPDGGGIAHFVTCIPLARKNPGALLRPASRNAEDTEMVNFVAPSFHASGPGGTCPAAAVTAAVAAFVFAAAPKKPAPEEVARLLRDTACLDQDALTSLPGVDDVSVRNLTRDVYQLVSPKEGAPRKLDAQGVLNLYQVCEELAPSLLAPPRDRDDRSSRRLFTLPASVPFRASITDVSPDGQVFLFTAARGLVEPQSWAYNRRTGKLSPVAIARHRSSRSATLSSGGDALLLADERSVAWHDLAGVERRRLYAAAPSEEIVSVVPDPERRRILVVTALGDGRRADAGRPGSLRVLDDRGEALHGPRPLERAGQAFWLGDGTRFLVAAREGVGPSDKTHLYVLGSDGRVLSKTTANTSYRDGAIGLSPDGIRAIFHHVFGSFTTVTLGGDGALKWVSLRGDAPRWNVRTTDALTHGSGGSLAAWPAGGLAAMGHHLNATRKGESDTVRKELAQRVTLVDVDAGVQRVVAEHFVAYRGPRRDPIFREQEPPPGDETPIGGVCFSADGRWLYYVHGRAVMAYPVAALKNHR